MSVHKSTTGALLTLAFIAVSGPAAARFVSVDPVQANPNTGENFNRYYYGANNPYRYTDPDGRAITSVNPANNAKIETNFNIRAAGEFKFDGNNQLQRVGEGSTDFRSTSYNDALVQGINATQNINISIQPTVNGVNIDTNHGGGVTGVLPSGDIAVIVSGNSLQTVDAGGNQITENAADITMHEFVGHAIPQLSPNPTGNAITNDNQARSEIGLPLAPPDPTHKEK